MNDRGCTSDRCTSGDCLGEDEEDHCRFCGQTLLSWFNIPCCKEYVLWLKKQGAKYIIATSQGEL